MKLLCAVFISLCLCGTLWSSSPQKNKSTNTQRVTLVEVHGPDVSQLEPDVRSQLKSGQDELIGAIKDASSTDTKLSLAYGGLGEIYHAYSLLAPAQECYLNASRLAPKELRWIYLLAKVEHLQGHADEALRDYQTALSLQPSFVPAQVNLANLYLELNRLAEATANFVQVLQREPDNAAAHYGLGQVALSKRNYAEAVEHLERALSLLPEANRIHYPLALAYRGLGNTEKAKAQLSQQGTVGVRVIDPVVDRVVALVQGSRVHMIRGKLAAEAKRFAEAAIEFQGAIEAEPENVAAHVNLGATLTQLGDKKGAADQFEKALQLDPNNVTAHFNLAILSASNNQHPQAIEHLKAVLKINTNDLDARKFLARALEKSNRIDEAIAEFTRLSEMDPDNEAAVIELAQLLQRQSQFKEALSVVLKSHLKYPERTNTKLLLTYMLAASPQLDLRDGTHALALSQELYRANPSSQNGTLVVLSLAELGRCTEATAWQQRLIADAVKQNKLELAEKLKADLSRYENVQSCRP